MSRTTAGVLALVFSVVGVVTWWIARESLNTPTATPPTEWNPPEVVPRRDGLRPAVAPERRAGRARPGAAASARTAPASGTFEKRPAPSRREGDRVTLLVIDAVRDRPIPDAEVIVDEARHRADAKGTLRLEFEPPLYLCVEVRARGYCRSEFRVTDTSPEGAANLAEAIRLRVPPAAAIEGTLRDAGGVAQADREVGIFRGNRARSLEGDDDEPLAVVRESRFVRKTRTDASGAFRIDALPAGIDLRIGVLASLRRGRLICPTKVIVLAPGETRHVDLTALPAGTVAGRVADQRGEPVCRAQVQSLVKSPSFGGVPVYFGRARTDRFGAFRIPGVPIGPGTLVVKPSARDLEEGLGFGVTQASFEIHRHGEQIHEEISVIRGLAIRGRVVSPDRAPLPGVRVETVGATEPSYGVPRAVTLSTRTRADGAFALTPVSPETYRIIARGQGPHGDSRVVETKGGATDIVLRLRTAAQIAGRVTDADTGEPVRARVTAWSRSPPTGAPTADTDLDGRFRLERILPGNYDLVAVSHTRKKIGVLGRLELTEGKACRGVTILVREAGALRIESQSRAELDELRVESAGCTVFAESRFDAAIALPIPVPANERIGVRAVVRAKSTSPEQRFTASVTVPAGRTVTATLAAAQ